MKRIVIPILLFTAIIIQAQEVEISFGVASDLNFKLKAKPGKANYPSIRVYVGLAYNHTLINPFENNRGQFNASTNLVIYNKTLGNSINKDFQDNQIDWTSHVGFTYMNGFSNLKEIQTINNSYLYNTTHDGEYAVSVGSNFIMNNHNRNQSLGYLSATTKNFSFTYYNDGPPFGFLGLGDAFDRFWTGGIKFYLHDFDHDSNLSFNRVEFAFDQFTGYTPDLYEISGILGADLQDYDLYQRLGEYNNSVTDTTQTPNLNISVENNNGYDFNASRYELQYAVNPFLHLRTGIRGSLRDDKTDRYYGLQDWIHICRGEPVHPTTSENLLYLGINYNNRIWKN